ncbi:serine carboxypeptidase-like 7 isoform X3 [Cucurbita maxima]|uniref:Serine carboxypeptidase-like 7 isoform X3 n=1 Tax=Cucurbita maxima TaxID=3661 RepID=A0A6J1IWS6_CUCMA|nr:serine carboxypeptidase-like 7 isoform X3 [Cucurbita maxima]
MKRKPHILLVFFRIWCAWISPMATFGGFRSYVCFLVLIFQVLSAAAAGSFWSVKYLPGFAGPLPFELETGYVGVGDSEEVQVFYYFVKSQGNPQTDPLMTWLIGGPGCSALSGFAVEIGPVNFKIEPYNGSTPQLILNPHSWTKKASILFIDMPVGTGFSYARTPQGLKKGDLLQVQQNHQFLRKWLTDHPEFIPNPFYVGGDSYSGIIIPPLTQAISEGNKHLFPAINLQGYIEGNPFSVRRTVNNYRVHYAHKMSLVSDELYESLKTSCKGEFESIDPINLECIKHVSTYKKCVSRISLACIMCPYCTDASRAPENTFGGQRSLYDTSQNLFLAPRVLPPLSLDCDEYKYYLSYYWANDNQVRKALHIREGTVGEWFRCESKKDYQFDITNVLPYHVNLSSKDYRSLIFSGDHDMMVPILDTEAWIKSLNYSIVDEWRPWFDDEDQVLGYTRTFANNMTFATIKGGGHTPQTMQYQTSIMFNRWMARKSL